MKSWEIRLPFSCRATHPRTRRRMPGRDPRRGKRRRELLRKKNFTEALAPSESPWIHILPLHCRKRYQWKGETKGRARREYEKCKSARRLTASSQISADKKLIFRFSPPRKRDWYRARIFPSPRSQLFLSFEGKKSCTASNSFAFTVRGRLISGGSQGGPRNDLKYFIKSRVSPPDELCWSSRMTSAERMEILSEHSALPLATRKNNSFNDSGGNHHEVSLASHPTAVSTLANRIATKRINFSRKPFFYVNCRLWGDFFVCLLV